MKDLFVSILPIILVMAGVFATTVYVLIKSELTLLWKTLLTPVAFVSSAVVPYVFVLLLGLSIPIPLLPDGVTILQHHTLVKDGKKERIEVWIATDSGTRLFSIPYSKKFEQQLEAARKARKDGYVTRLKPRNGKPGTLDDDGIEALAPEHFLPPKGEPEREEEPEPPPQKPGLMT